MKKRKRVKVKYSNVILTTLVSILVILITVTGFTIRHILKDTLDSNVKEVKIVDSIQNYDYKLTAHNTDYFGKLFKELKKLLEAKEKSADFEEEYAKLISQMFIADFYDLDSKVNKIDIGGVQFIYQPYRDTFKEVAGDINGIYYYVENNAYGNRKQELPSVTEVVIVSTDNIRYEYGELKDDEAFEIKVSVKYKKDLGYDKDITLILVNNGKKIEIVEMR